ncbi:MULTISPECIES: dihydrodipicolinate synthase family protein [unclassified Roseovarius]|uniref:dihydrodipicolinate synthase family protein n=1 Tax=unclassified Roseovarius TaxID=2614913 RepID=UPI00273DBCA1|nr:MULTISPECIES: dihydrodipicolinate synthase family protein [unclassified Roseovarius]
MTEPMRGVITPILTPYNDDHSIATDLYLEHAAGCLSEGAHYLSPFGTTSEALSNSSRERMEMLELLISSGVARPDQLMPGTGLNALEETLTLSRHAVALGCAGVMTLPPFFFVTASDEGLYRYFSQLTEGVGSDALKICLYHIPQNTGIGISPGLAARLNRAFPEVVVAYKDSSGNWDNTKAVIEAAPGISVFPGSESFMIDAMKIGGGGCISASCNSNVGPIRAMFDQAAAGDWDAASAMQPGVNAHRQAVQAGGLIPALKAFKADQTGDARWLNLRAPLENADAALAAGLVATLP